MKPPKPRIIKARLKWAYNARKGIWEPYHRVTWTDGGKRRERAILLKWNLDPKELDRLYWECERGAHDKQQPAAPKYTWHNLIIEWRSDPRIQRKLADSTKRSYGRDMERILEKNAMKDVRKTTRQGLRAAHSKLADTPRKADKYLTVISLLWNYGAVKLDWPLGPNPAEGIDHFGKQREFLPWPEWMIAKLDTAPETMRSTAELILNTGQHPNATIEMKREHFRGEWMEVLDEKDKERFEIYCPLTLRAYLDTLPIRGTHVIAKNLTEPLGYDAVQKRFRKWRDGLGEKAKPFTLHSLRKLSII